MKPEKPNCKTLREKASSVVDDVVLNKAAIIERCVKGAREDFPAAGAHFATDHARHRLPPFAPPQTGRVAKCERRD
jgi:hypothetical protein